MAIHFKHKYKICGLDEAGRGALAGPITVAAVVIPFEFRFDEVAPMIIVKDSKKLSKQQREELFCVIVNYSLKIDIETISVQEINTKGINWANMVGFERLISRIDADQYIIDGRWNLQNLAIKDKLVKCIVDADEHVPAVLSAGIVAKVKRDEIMQSLSLKYPIYGWDTNTGHGTKYHIEAIMNYGLCEHHRIKFVTTCLKNWGSYGKNNKRSK